MNLKETDSPNQLSKHNSPIESSQANSEKQSSSSPRHQDSFPKSRTSPPSSPFSGYINPKIVFSWLPFIHPWESRNKTPPSDSRHQPNIEDSNPLLLPSDWHSFLCLWWADASFLTTLTWSTFCSVYTSLMIQEAAFFDRAGSTKHLTNISIPIPIVGSIETWRAEVRYIFWKRMLRADACNTTFRCFASFGERVVT